MGAARRAGSWYAAGARDNSLEVDDLKLLSGLEGIFIDFYGTIACGDRAAVEHCCARVVADLGLRMTAAELAVRWGEVFFSFIGRHNGERFHTLTELEELSLVETLGPGVGPFAPAPFVRELVDYWRYPPLFAEAKEAVESLSVPICCVSNVDTADIFQACEHHGLHFDRIITSEKARSYKPDGRIFEVALEQTGWSRQGVIHVGDSLHSDVMGAHRVGLRAVWVKRSDRILDIGQAHPEWTVSNLSELFTL